MHFLLFLYLSSYSLVVVVLDFYLVKSLFKTLPLGILQIGDEE